LGLEMSELLYTVRTVAARAWNMAVFEDGSDTPRDVYWIRGSKCWCPSSKERCKHLDILDKFRCEAPDGDYSGLVYDLEADKFTRLLGQGDM
jgi:hypothetical protein